MYKALNGLSPLSNLFQNQNIQWYLELYFCTQMAMSTVLHHMCTAGALVLLLVSGIKQDGPCRGTTLVYSSGLRQD